MDQKMTKNFRGNPETFLLINFILPPKYKLITRDRLNTFIRILKL